MSALSFRSMRSILMVLNIHFIVCLSRKGEPDASWHSTSNSGNESELVSCTIMEHPRQETPLDALMEPSMIFDSYPEVQDFYPEVEYPVVFDDFDFDLEESLVDPLSDVSSDRADSGDICMSCVLQRHYLRTQPLSDESFEESARYYANLVYTYLISEPYYPYRVAYVSALSLLREVCRSVFDRA